jgi:hypothetical protein
MDVFRKACLAVSALMLSASATLAADTTAASRWDAQHRINVTGRQGMLSERIAKAACLVSRDPANGAKLQELFEAREVFMFSRKVLRTGSAEMGLAAETSLAPVQERASALAQKYDGVVYDFAAALPFRVNNEKLEKIYELNLPVLNGLNDAVDFLESRQRDGHLVRRGLAAGINVSTLLRMLSQKMVKEACEIASGYKTDETRNQLKGTIALFASSHENLKRGMIETNIGEREGMPVVLQLMLVERHWAELSKRYAGISEGGTPADEDLAKLAAEGKVLLAELNRTVELLEAIDIPRAMN